MGNRERLIKRGWKQGMILIPGDCRLQAHAHHPITNDDRLLIVSQTCDLVQGSFERDPYFEVLCLHPMDRAPDGGYRGGKNSRRIEFDLKLPDSTHRHWYALPYERHVVDRKLLLSGLQPAFLIEDSNTLKMILRWLSGRYTRTAFPEAFVSRIDARRGAIGKKLARLNDFVSNIFVRLLPFEELSTGQSYGIEIILLMEADTFDNETVFKECNEIKEELRYQIGKCKDIQVEDIRIASTAELTIGELNDFMEWDFSYLSFRDPDGAAIPVEI